MLDDNNELTMRIRLFRDKLFGGVCGITPHIITGPLIAWTLSCSRAGSILNEPYGGDLQDVLATLKINHWY